MAKTYTWTTAPRSGFWNSPGNWTDTTDGTEGTAAPGASDTAVIPGGAGVQFQIVAGPGSGDSLTTYGNNAFEGGLIFVGKLTMGAGPAGASPAGLDNSDALDLEPGDAVTSTGVTVYQDFEVDGGRLFSGSGFDVLSGPTLPTGEIAGTVVAVNGGVIEAATEMTFAAGRLVEDGTAVVEVGTAGGAAKGVVTVDPGTTLNIQGLFTLNDAVTDNGSVVVSNTATPGVSINESITGAGAFTTGTSAVVDITNASLSGLASVSVGQSSNVTFFGGSVTGVGAVTLNASSSLTTDALTNDGPVTLASNASLTAGAVSGSSTITVGSGGKLTITGALSGLSGVTMGNSSVLTLTGAGDTNVPINLGTRGNVALNLSAGSNIGGAVTGFDNSDLIENRPTSSNHDIINRVSFTPGTLALLDGTKPDTTIAVSGSYAGQTFITNFTGITYGDTDITLPGVVVTAPVGPGTETVTGSAYRLFTLLTGGGNSGALTLKGNLALQGAYTATSLSNISSAAGTTDATDIEANSSLTVSGNATVSSNLQLTDDGARFTVGGLLTLGGDPSYEPQVLLAGASSLRAGNLTITGSTGGTGSETVPNLGVLGNGSVEIGGGNLATAGTIAIDPGATLTLAIDLGDVSAPTVIDDGLIAMANSAQGVSLNYSASSAAIDANIIGTGTIQAYRTLLVTGTVSGVAIDVGGSLTVDGNVSGLQSLTLRANTTTSLYGLSYTQALEVGASASLTVGGLAGTGVLTGLASLTLDAGASAKFTGTVTNVGAITVGNNGSLEFDKGGSGSGAIALGTGVKLTLVNGAVTGWNGVSLAGSDTIATYGANGGLPPISGFDTSDKVTLTTSTFYSSPRGLYYTGATWVQGAGSGTLTLTEDGQAMQSYTLAGTYNQSQFITVAVGNVEGTGVGASVLTLNFGAQNGLNGATLTGATGGSYLLLTGTGSQSALTITNNVAVSGTFTLGTVQFTSLPGTGTTTDDVVLVQAGASISAGSATINDSVEVDGAGAVLNVAGTVAFNDTTGGNALLAYNGATVQLGGTTTATTYDFDSVDFAVDTTGSIEVGHAGGAALNALTVDAGATFRTDSGANIGTAGGSMVINGAWVADNNSSNTSGLGTGVSNIYVWNTNVSGSGSIQIASGTSMTVVQSVSGLSAITASGGGGLTVSGSLLGIGAVTINAGSYVKASGVGTSNYSGGTLTLTDAANNSSTASFYVNNNAVGTGALSIGAHDSFFAGGATSGWTSITVGNYGSVEFGMAEVSSPITLGAGSALRLDAGATVSGVIYGFGKTDFISYGFNTTTSTPVITTATWASTGNGLGTLTLSDDGQTVTTLTLAGDYSGEQFLTNFAGENNHTIITLADPPCYCPGTLIRTRRGEVPVEELAEGDMVVTLSGALRPVVWIGRRSYGARFVRRTRSLHPVCIKAGALAPGMPAQDLWVSPQHAIFGNGVLVPARLLVNGTTVVQPSAAEDVHYLHVELPEHDVIWANGLAAESFVDDGSRGMFHNAHERAHLDAVEPVFCAPRVEAGEKLEAARRRFAGREAA